MNKNNLFPNFDISKWIKNNYIYRNISIISNLNQFDSVQKISQNISNNSNDKIQLITDIIKYSLDLKINLNFIHNPYVKSNNQIKRCITTTFKNVSQLFQGISKQIKSDDNFVCLYIYNIQLDNLLVQKQKQYTFTFFLQIF